MAERYGSDEILQTTDTEKVYNREGTKFRETIIKCDICLKIGNHNIAEKFCLDCVEYLCKACQKDHMSFKATRIHKVSNMDDLVVQKKLCEPCKYRSKDRTAKYVCKDCEENLCSDCTFKHKQMNIAEHHSVEQIQQQTKPKRFCGICIKSNKYNKAVAFCLDCNPQELLCSECLEDHAAFKKTRGHKTEYSLAKYSGAAVTISKEIPSEQQILRKEKYKTADYIIRDEILASACASTIPTDDDESKGFQNQQMKVVKQSSTNLAKYQSRKKTNTKREEKKPQEDLPGKPTLDGDAKADGFQLRWTHPRKVYDQHQYQIRFKTTTPSDKWKFYHENFEESTVVLEKLKSDSTFTFQVRMVNNDKEGPYSSESDPIRTKQSAAIGLIGCSIQLENPDSILTKRKILLTEIEQARDQKAKTRQLYLGSPTKTHCKEKTIMLVGATGSGKSTLVDGFINYILGVNWDDPFRFTLIDLEEDERKVKQNQAVSQTQWITTYCINPENGSRLDYRLNIIDTPGFGDTRGLERDKQIVDQIREMFSASSANGVVFLDAVCFITKAPDARLTPTQNYIFNAILSIFGKDIADNVQILITFADGKTPPVLSALKEARLPHQVYFPFNNSSLFENNCGPNMSPLSPMFWEMGCNSFKTFFEHLRTMKTKSLKQTREVLLRRQEMEMNIENLSPLVSNGLNKLDELKVEIRVIEQHKTEIDDNADFRYTVPETRQLKKDLPSGQHVTNCLHCHVTCHKNCAYPNDADKKYCQAMNSSGNCTQCSQGCSWNQHANTPYIFDYETVQVTKTYKEKEEKYRKAKGEKMTREKVLQCMTDELFALQTHICDLMNIVNKCSNILKEIALRPNPLGVKEHIDLLIESEKQEKREGFKRRIASLLACRQQCDIENDVKRLQTDFQSTIKCSNVTVENIKTEKQSILEKLMFWK